MAHHIHSDTFDLEKQMEWHEKIIVEQKQYTKYQK